MIDILQKNSLFIKVTIYFYFFILTSGQIWDQTWPSPTTATIQSGSYGDNKFLLFGNEGTVLQSSNGMEWTNCDSPTDG